MAPPARGRREDGLLLVLLVPIIRFRRHFTEWFRPRLPGIWIHYQALLVARQWLVVRAAAPVRRVGGHGGRGQQGAGRRGGGQHSDSRVDSIRPVGRFAAQPKVLSLPLPSVLVWVDNWTDGLNQWNGIAED